MPAPVAVYVVAAIGTVAAAIAFKEFIYEPHIAPKVERWAEEFLEKRRAKKAAAAARVAVPVFVRSETETDSLINARDNDGKSMYELENRSDDGVRQWRSQVGSAPSAGLRHRKPNEASSLPSRDPTLMYSPMSPSATHVLFDHSDALTNDSSPASTSTLSSRVASPLPHSTLFQTPLRAPPPPLMPLTPEPSVRGLPRGSSLLPSPVQTPQPVSPQHVAHSLSDSAHTSAHSPYQVPSLSLSHPLDLDSEHDLELLSAPASSRPASPFSELSVSGEDSQYHSFHSFGATMTSPPNETADDDLERWSSAGSEVSGSSWDSVDRTR
ncbi:unnamed protein product [Mycena citricolor]|uniref:Uncharacterized protein n=1 Tax=Mycena citricolor TaxID=2018698 RepID=A0AAD2H3E4_9AGAR|nr:unnamed protein product [Mycena citricolor]